jgi:drug/metabolite transporter (DMT)-like permease
MPRARGQRVSGYYAAAIAVLVWASYPVATRAGVTGSFAPHELVALRFGVGGLLFLPYVALHFRDIRRAAWLQGIPLTLFQGAGMGALVICGLQFAPAHHAAALGPGVSPAWVALLGFLLFAKRPSMRVVAGSALCLGGVVALVMWSASANAPQVLLGDAMFLAASALGALYVLQLRNWGMGTMQGAALVSIYSALVVVPWHFWSATASFSRFAPQELIWQVLWQGVLIGCVALVALNHAIARLGAERSCALVAMVPVLSAGFALVFLGEMPSGLEMAAFLAISAGVSMQAIRPLAAPPQSARLAGYRVRGSAP